MGETCLGCLGGWGRRWEGGKEVASWCQGSLSLRPGMEDGGWRGLDPPRGNCSSSAWPGPQAGLREAPLPPSPPRGCPSCRVSVPLPVPEGPRRAGPGGWGRRAQLPEEVCGRNRLGGGCRGRGAEVQPASPSTPGCPPRFQECKFPLTGRPGEGLPRAPQGGLVQCGVPGAMPGVPESPAQVRERSSLCHTSLRSHLFPGASVGPSSAPPAQTVQPRPPVAPIPRTQGVPRLTIGPQAPPRRAPTSSSGCVEREVSSVLVCSEGWPGLPLPAHIPHLPLPAAGPLVHTRPSPAFLEEAGLQGLSSKGEAAPT